MLSQPMITANIHRTLIVTTLLILAGLLLLTAASTQARQFRIIQPIATPENVNDALPDGARPVESVQPVTREQLEPHLRKLFQDWESGQIDEHLAEDFWDSQRLLDTLDVVVPRDANLRLQSIQGIQTLSQYMQQDAETGGDERVSIVSATVRTQLEFNTPGGGFIRRPGVNEFILQVTETTVQ